MIYRVYLHIAFILAVSATAAIAQEENGSSAVEIGRGSCGSQQFYAYVITCAIPSATPAMTLSVSVVRQISRYPCIKGQNFGLAPDNSYLWVSRGCTAEFSISKVTHVTATTTARLTPHAQTLTTTTASTTPIQTTSTTRPTTVTITSPPTTSTTVTTTSPPTTPTTVTTTSPTATSTTATTTSPPTTATTITTAPTAERSNAAFCGQAGSNGFRIIGGTEADTCEFPWMVMIYDQLKNSLCGGTIIDSRHIITAAHCFFVKNERTNVVRKSRANELLVFSGSSTMPLNGANVDGLVRRIVTQVTTHEKYNHTSLENDIAVLTLSAPIVFDSCHQPICMVDGSKTPQQASNCRTMGWGITSNDPNAQASSQLQYVDVPVVSDASCKAVYGSLSSSKTFCAGREGRDSCQGDSGGPFTCQEQDGAHYLYGIVSAGVSGRCAEFVGIYSRSSAFLDWINSKIG